MLKMESNLVRLEREGSVKEDIEEYLGNLESENTRIKYANEIKKFLGWKFKDIPVEHLQHKDINNLSYTDMQKFKQFLKRKGYANGTINGNMKAIVNLCKELNRIKVNGKKSYQIDVEDLKVKALKETDKEEYGLVTWEELENWRKWLTTLPKSQHPERKSAWLKLAMVTGIRKQGLADLKFGDLKQEDGVWVICHTLKGKKNKIAIPDEDAQMLLDLRVTSDKNESILKMSSKTMERTLKKILEHFEIDKDRNIVIHSIRGESGYTAYKASGNDITVAMKHLNHSNAATTMNYISKREDLKKMPSLYMTKEISSDDLDNLTVDQWRKLFDSVSRGTQFDILNKAKELGYSQE